MKELTKAEEHVMQVLWQLEENGLDVNEVELVRHVEGRTKQKRR